MPQDQEAYELIRVLVAEVFRLHTSIHILDTKLNMVLHKQGVSLESIEELHSESSKQFSLMSNDQLKKRLDEALSRIAAKGDEQ